ncbi:MAG: Ger(x)C family spore germination protein [Bacillota bacterium]
MRRQPSSEHYLWPIAYLSGAGRRAVVTATCMAVAFCLAGCWDRTEVDDIAFVTGIGLDAAPGNQVYVTFHIAVPRALAGGGGPGGGGGSGGGTQQTTLITTLMGRSVVGVVNLMNAYVDRRPSFVHGKVIVIGEALARRGVAPYISELVRFRETRRTMFLVVAKGTAKEFMERNRPVIEQNPTKNLELLALTNRQTGLVPPSQLHRFLVEMQSLGEEPLVILAGVKEERPGGRTEQGRGGQEESTGVSQDGGEGGQDGVKDGQPKEPSKFPEPPPRPTRTDEDYTAGTSPRAGGNPVEFLGAAVFRGDRMAGEISGDEVRAVLLLRGTFKRGIAASTDPFVESRYVSYDVRLARPTQIKITRSGQSFHVQVKIMLEGEVIGTQTRVDYSNPKNLRTLEKHLAAEIKKFAQDTIKKAQTDFQADIFAFGNKARHLTTTWQQWVDLDWPEKFPRASIDVDVSVELRRTGLLFKPPAPTPRREPDGSEG